IVRGKMGVDELSRDTLTDPDILRISRATELIDDPYLTEISVGKRWAAVTIVMADGQEYSEEPRTPQGDRDDPLSDQTIREKFYAFTTPILGGVRATRIHELTTNFDQIDDREFSQLLELCLSAA
ncbi:MAG: MmgE/PrpD family protein, partial [Hyphomicrobiales bacterium]|nr:MmgE/PrpD family protein [Hyphomicrobiales bacterium]